MVRDRWSFRPAEGHGFGFLSWQHPWPSEGGTCTPEPFGGGSNYTSSVDETIAASLVQGGIDYNCGALYRTNLYSSLLRGAVSKQDVDKAVSRVYRTHFRLGFYDDASSQPLNFLPPETVDSAEHRAVALRAARESMVLLRNDGGLLPLTSSSKLAFLGPLANATIEMLSNYHGDNTLVESHSPLLAAQARGLRVSYAKGCNICDVSPPGFPNMCTGRQIEPSAAHPHHSPSFTSPQPTALHETPSCMPRHRPCPNGNASDTSGIDAAVAAAKAADVAVLRPRMHKRPLSCRRLMPSCFTICFTICQAPSTLPCSSSIPYPLLRWSL